MHFSLLFSRSLLLRLQDVWLKGASSRGGRSPSGTSITMEDGGEKEVWLIPSTVLHGTPRNGVPLHRSADGK